MTKKLFPVISILVFLLFVFYLSIGGDKEHVVRVEEREIRTMVYGSGYAKRKNYVVLKSEVSGYVSKVLVEEGQYVRPGQPLVVIDSGSLDASIREVDSKLQLVRERIREGSDYLKSLEKAIESAHINMENAASLLERREKLLSEGFISKEAYEQAKTNYELAKSEYEKALSVYKDAKSFLKNEERVLSAQRERLLKEREKFTIRSPLEGRVLKKYINPGDFVSPLHDSKLFSIGSDGWEVILDVDEEYAGLLREGQRVLLKVDAYPGRTFEGRVEKVVREVDQSRKLLQVKVSVDLPEDLPNGSTVDANIEVQPKKVLLIPKRAYRDGYVLLYDGTRRLRVPVRVGRDYGEHLEVLEGLKPGDWVVLP